MSEHIDKVDVKDKYPTLMKSSLLVTLLLFIIIFATVPKISVNPYKMRAKREVTEMQKLPENEMQKVKEPEQISKPQLPKKIVETEDAKEVTQELNIETNFEQDLNVDNETEIYRIYETPPKPLTKVDPSYPDMARQLGIEGTVILELVVEKDGRVSSVRVLKSVHPLLDDAAIAAAYRTTFSPAMTRDLSIRSYVAFPVIFRLRQ